MKKFLISLCVVSVCAINAHAGMDKFGNPTLDPEVLKRLSQTGFSQKQDGRSGLEIFSEAIVYIKHYYYKEINEQELFEKILQGGLPKFDRHTHYLNEKEKKIFEENMRGSFFGIGAMLGQKIEKNETYVVIMSVMEDSPAEKAGLRSGDYLVAISSNGAKKDAISVENLSVDEARQLIRGPKDTKVYLGVTRDGKYLEFIITRGEINTAAVKAKSVARNVGYLRFSSFEGDKLMDDFEMNVSSMQKNGMKVLILDLRNNPGGLVTYAVTIGNWFNKGNTKSVVVMKGKAIDETSSGNWLTRGKFKNIPVIVLTNEGTASASEIVTALLKNYCGAIVVGTKTFGKGVGQSVIELKGGGVLVITSFEYFVGDKNISVNGVGIVPTIEVKNPESVKSEADDLQLKRAIEEANKLIKL